MSSLYIDELNVLTYVDLGPRGTTARREFNLPIDSLKIHFVWRVKQLC